ncbi:MAG: YicC family protein [Polynucleobacter sp.]|nr:YicC family protein [Polynucleobacter sp.]
MIVSMTGFGSASQQVQLGSGVFADLQLECRAVNSRFLDLSFRLPDECRSAEAGLREMVMQKIARGKVEFRAAWRAPKGNQANTDALSLNPARLRALLSLQDEVRKESNLAGELRIADILRWPGMVSEPQAEEEGWRLATLSAGQAAFGIMLASRQREGEALGAVLNTILSKMNQVVEQLEPKIPHFVNQYQAKLVARLTETMQSYANNTQSTVSTELMERIRQEVILYAVKIDVAEEFARLKTHLNAITEVLNKGGQVGKRLDFLMQELNREANTLGSKSVAEESTTAAVELKLLIEQMREQVQNLE